MKRIYRSIIRLALSSGVLAAIMYAGMAPKRWG